MGSLRTVSAKKSAACTAVVVQNRSSSDGAVNCARECRETRGHRGLCVPAGSPADCGLCLVSSQTETHANGVDIVISRKKGGPCVATGSRSCEKTSYQQPTGAMGCGESKHGDVSPSEQVEQDLAESRINSHYHSKVRKNKRRVCHVCTSISLLLSCVAVCR